LDPAAVSSLIKVNPQAFPGITRGDETLIRESTYAVSARMFMAFCRAALLIIVANVLGAESQGSFGLALAVMTLAVLLGSAGLEIATIYYTAQNPEKIGSLLIHVVFWGVAAGFILSAFTYAALVLLPGYFKGFPVSFIWSTPLAVWCTLLNLYVGAIMLGNRDYKWYFVVTLIQYGVILASVGLISLWGYLTTNALMPAWVAGTFLGTTTAFLHVGSVAHRKGSKLKVDWKLLKDQLLYGTNAYVNNLTNMLNYKLGLFILAAFVSATSLGYFSMSLTITDGLLYIPKGIGTVVLARESALGDRSQVHRLYKINSIVMGTLVLAMFILAPWGIPFVLSDAFKPAILSFMIILPGTWMLSLAIMASNQLFGMGMSKVPSQGAVLNLSITLLLNLVLIPLYDVEGAAIAAAIGYSVYAIYLLQAIHRFNDHSIKELLIPRLSDFLTLIDFFRRLKAKYSS
jgi:O-antigen/teichoic acid export membrane protein